MHCLAAPTPPFLSPAIHDCDAREVVNVIEGSHSSDLEHLRLIFNLRGKFIKVSIRATKNEGTPVHVIDMNDAILLLVLVAKELPFEMDEVDWWTLKLAHGAN